MDRVPGYWPVAAPGARRWRSRNAWSMRDPVCSVALALRDRGHARVVAFRVALAAGTRFGGAAFVLLRHRVSLIGRSSLRPGLTRGFAF